MNIESYKKSTILKQANFLKEMNLYPFFRAIQETKGSTVTVNNQKQVMIGSNNYLGLTHHPEVIEAAIKATEKYGTGCTGSRLLNGNLDIHEELEEKLAKYVGHEAALLFSTGMQSNLGSITALAQKNDVIISDEENHASIIDATRLSKATVLKYNHNDMIDLQRVLEENRSKYERALIVADGVFSMTGDIMKLPETVEIAEKYDAMIYVDDAHGLGTLGEHGEGTMAHFNMTDRVHFNMSTFSKSFASIGGFLSGEKEAISYVRHKARSFIFSASMPPSAVATVSKCIDIAKRDDSIHKNLRENTKFMREGFQTIGLYTYCSQTPIIPIFVGDDVKVMQLTKYLGDNGVFATPVVSPAVPEGEALIRTSYMASHQKADLEYALETIAKAKVAFDLPATHP